MSNTPVISRRRLPSAVWFLPFLAAMIAGWLIYKNYSEKGVEIEIYFDSAAGLEAGKTKVLYRGLPAGVVKTLNVDPNLKRVRASVEMVPQVTDNLTDQAQFWLVKPQVSLSGIQGLETLLSGHYIAFQPGEAGNRQNRYTALDQPPPPVKNDKGLYITLTAQRARSVYQGAKLYYRDIEVGEVLSHALGSDGKEVLIEAYIEPHFSYLIRENTRFWNASGISVKADLPKIDIQVGSLASIIAGGIHFSTPDEQSPVAAEGQRFELHEDYEAALDGIEVALRFPGATNLSSGAAVKSQGIQVGRVKSAQLTDDFKHLDTVLLIDPRARELLRESSRFWLHKPDISLENLGQIGNLLQGSYIELEPGQGAEKLSFTALEIAPTRRLLTMGKAIELRTSQLGSISKGSPILYRQMPVGEVLNYELDDQGNTIIVHAAIEQRYSHLVTGSSRFWNASGMDIRASLEGIAVKTGSAAALLRGGIAFFNPTGSNLKEPPTYYSLFEDFYAATEGGKLTDTQLKDALPVRFSAHTAGSLSAGDPILYKQIKVGELSRVKLDKSGQAVTLHGFIYREFKHLVSDASRFWLADGIQAQASLKHVEIRTESLQTLLTGGIAFENHGKGRAVNTNHLFTLYPDYTSSVKQPLQVTIAFPSGKNIQPHAEVRLKGQVVGKVVAVALANEGKTINATVHLFRDGHFLARENAKFWVVAPKIRLSGIENPEGMITGNYIAASAGQGKAQFSFHGLDSPPPQQAEHGLQVIVHTDTLGSLQKGSPVFFRKVPVGAVTGFDLARDGSYVEVYAQIQPRYASLVKKDSEFSNISGVQVDVSLFGGVNVKADSIETLVGGGLSFTSPDHSPAAKHQQVFTITER